MARWLIDIDSTTMDTIGRQLALASERFGVAYTIDHITEWDWDDILPAEVCAYVWGDECFKNPSFHWTCPAVASSIKTVRGLLTAGNDVFFVSDRPDALYDVTRAWLDGWELDAADLIFTNRETYPKAQAAVDLRLSHVVEDAGHHAVDLAALDQVQRVYLVDYPYNRAIPAHPKITRVAGWAEIAADVLAVPI